MPASPNDPRTKRRKAAGDDVNKIAMAPQPVPGAPQGAGNQQNYPMVQTPSGEIGQPMGSGSYQFPYGDLGKGLGPAVEPVGFAQASGQPESIVPGRRLNGVYNAMPQPDAKQMETMGAMYEMGSSTGQNMPGGINNGQPVSYQVSPMGPLGTPAGAPGNIPQIDSQMWRRASGVLRVFQYVSRSD